MRGWSEFYRPALVVGTGLACALLLAAWPIPNARMLSQPAIAVPDLGIVMLPIPSGSYLQGSTTGEDDQMPLTTMTLSRFWMARTEITQAQWTAVMGPNPSSFRGQDLPVESVTHNDALAFCDRLTVRERLAGRLPAGYVYSLPTETQWEYACRAGGTPAPVQNLEEVAWLRTNSDYTTHPVATRQPNPWGLHDMQGNVWEWCLDWGATYPGGTRTDYLAPHQIKYRIRRGGSYRMPPSYCTATIRYAQPPGQAQDGIGFRIALIPAELYQRHLNQD